MLNKLVTVIRSTGITLSEGIDGTFDNYLKASMEHLTITGK